MVKPAAAPRRVALMGDQRTRTTRWMIEDKNNVMDEQQARKEQCQQQARKEQCQQQARKEQCQQQARKEQCQQQARNRDVTTTEEQTR